MSSVDSDYSDESGCMVLEVNIFFTLQDDVTKDIFTKQIENNYYETPIITWYNDTSGCVLITCYIEYGEGLVDDYINDCKESVEYAGAIVNDIQTKTY
jgi:hypothetical protein